MERKVESYPKLSFSNLEKVFSVLQKEKVLPDGVMIDLHGTTVDIIDPFYQFLNHPNLLNLYPNKINLIEFYKKHLPVEELKKFPLMKHPEKWVNNAIREFIQIPDQVANFKPYPRVLEDLKRLREAGLAPQLNSGASMSVHTETLEWLYNQGFLDHISLHDIYLRDTGKVPAFKKNVRERRRPLIVFDDDPEVIEMSSKENIPSILITHGLLLECQGDLIDHARDFSEAVEKTLIFYSALKKQDWVQDLWKIYSLSA